MPREITGFSNPLVKRVRSLREKKLRKREGLFLAEGLRILTEAREQGTLPEMLFMASGAQPHPLAEELAAEVEARGGDVILTSAEILSKISGTSSSNNTLMNSGEMRERTSCGPRKLRSIFSK